MNATNPGPAFMALIAIVFSFGIAWIAHRGINGSTSINIAINVVQISALLIFSVMALSYRANHPPGSVGYQFDSTSGAAYTYDFATKTVDKVDTIVRDANGVPQPKLDAAGEIVRDLVARLGLVGCFYFLERIGQARRREDGDGLRANRQD